MNRKEFVRKVAETLRDNDIRKPVSSPKHVFHISDDCGNSKDFVVKQSDKSILFTVIDIENIVDACLSVVADLLKNGDTLSIRGFGTLGLRYRKGRKMRDTNGEWIECPPGFMPKFTCGNELKRSAKLYEVAMQDKLKASRLLRGAGASDGT
jgi:nucleoid DNA-binding protein